MIRLDCTIAAGRHRQQRVDTGLRATYDPIDRFRRAQALIKARNRPVQWLKQWQIEKPDLFVKRVYKHAGLDT